MTQNIYDDPGFFAGYAQLRRSIDGLDGAPEWPALRALLPRLQGLDVVDLGCGYGWFCRWAAAHGARRVLGLDVSARMLERAAQLDVQAGQQDAGITYRQADLETVALPEAAFGLAYSSLTLHYLANLDRLLGIVYRALVPGGRLVFSIEHPIYMASRHPDWIADAQGHRTWPVDNYQNEGPRRTDWLAPGVIKQHRTLGTLLNAVMRAGFTLAHVEDWGPSAGQLAAQPALHDEQDRPMMLLVAARR
ncbi:class I SAM-dependent methyltransferase [Bordetella sp. BOR01]|uniref:class I SAM-dependent methyltransferase n=1 Tax=Bordetella sp. BOR01 TaxID=2854779 RepID=UPI001C465B5B|nr:class I SAM-dependent methyltransferase [Bordetella sp. BOR01]MBV7482664.1 class I SAM-dependent methyltransferase [Bordetella sp. BOR01]